MLCYLTTLESFPDAIASIRFKERTAIQVHNEKQRQLAVDNGLRTFYDCCTDGYCATNADFVQFDGGLPFEKAFENLRAEQKGIVKFSIYSLTDILNDQNTLGKAKDILTRGHAAHFQTEKFPQPLEVARLFSLLPSPQGETVNVTISKNGDNKICHWSEFNRPLTFVQFAPSLEFTVGSLLKKRKHRIAVLEATTGGSIAAALLSVPGASAFFISCAVVYTGRGAKRILPPEVLQASSLFDREKNYSNRENYVQSKIKYCEVVSQAMRTAMKADFVIVESGTTGPDFYIPGVEAFTAVGVAGPNGFQVVKVFDSSSRDRKQNMADFHQFALETLRDALKDSDSKADNGSRL